MGCAASFSPLLLICFPCFLSLRAAPSAISPLRSPATSRTFPPALLPLSAAPILPASSSPPDAAPETTRSAFRLSSYPACALHTSNSRSEEHTSELQSRLQLVCLLLLDKRHHDASFTLIYLMIV